MKTALAVRQRYLLQEFEGVRVLSLWVNSFHAPGDWGSAGGAVMVKMGGMEEDEDSFGMGGEEGLLLGSSFKEQLGNKSGTAW